MMTHRRSIVLAALGVALTLLALPARAAAQGTPMLGVLRGTNTLLFFNSASPGTILSSIPITGLAAGEVVRGIDVRPATGVLYALATPNMQTTQVRLYTLNPVTGAATPIGAAVTVPIAGNFWGMSFNAVVDRVRVVNDFGVNVRLHPDTGALVVDTALNGVTTPTVDSIAYDSQVAGATQTTLYGINLSGNSLVRIGGAGGIPSPNGGGVSTVGPLGISLVGTATALDVAPDGTLYGVAGLAGANSSLYTIDTTTGAATLVGQIGNGSTVDSIAVAAAGLAISPPSGTYTQQQRFDVVLLLNAPGRALVGGAVTFDGLNVTGYIASCARLGQTASGLTTIRCGNLGGPLFGPGTHTFAVNLLLDNGASVASSAAWTVLPSVEP